MAVDNKTGTATEKQSPDVSVELSSSHDLHETEASGTVVPPDGGYGWVVVGASFTLIFIVDNVVFCFGIFFREFLAHYGESKETTAWLGSVMGATSLVTGPLVAALCNRFGCRAVTIAGSVMAAVAQLTCTLSVNFPALLVTYGLLTGTGLGMMYLPAVVMVGYYFSSRRALATGIAGCGAGVGSFAMAPLCEKLISIYGWKGAIWVMAGICLNGAVCGALYRPLEAEKQQSSDTNSESGKEQHLTPNISPKSTIHGDMYDAKRNLLDPHYRVSSNGEVHSMKNLSTFAHQPHQVSSSKSYDNIHNKHLDIANSELRLSSSSLKGPFHNKDVYYTGSIPNLEGHHKTDQVTKTISRKHKHDWCCLSILDTLRELMDFSLLCDPVFCIYGLSCFLCMAGFYVPFFYLPDMAVSFGMSRAQGAFLISIAGIANVLGRVGCGWMSDQPWADCLIINNCALVLGGAVTIICPYCQSFPLLATYSFVFGACIAVFISLRSIIMVELMGLEKLTTAFGLVTMCQGISGYIGAPIAGALFDASGYYYLSFYVAGGTLAMAGAICFPLRRVAAWWHHHQLHKDNGCSVADVREDESAEMNLLVNCDKQAEHIKESV